MQKEHCSLALPPPLWCPPKRVAPTRRARRGRRGLAPTPRGRGARQRIVEAPETRNPGKMATWRTDRRAATFSERRPRRPRAREGSFTPPRLCHRSSANERREARAYELLRRLDGRKKRSGLFSGRRDPSPRARTAPDASRRRRAGRSRFRRRGATAGVGGGGEPGCRNKAHGAMHRTPRDGSGAGVRPACPLGLACGRGSRARSGRSSARASARGHEKSVASRLYAQRRWTRQIRGLGERRRETGPAARVWACRRPRPSPASRVWARARARTAGQARHRA